MSEITYTLLLLSESNVQQDLIRKLPSRLEGLQSISLRLLKLWRINWANMSTQVSGTPGRHQCMQSWPHTCTASFFPNQMAGWASTRNSLKWVRLSTRISLPWIASFIRPFRSLTSLLTPLLLGSNHMLSCSGLSIYSYHKNDKIAVAIERFQLE